MGEKEDEAAILSAKEITRAASVHAAEGIDATRARGARSYHRPLQMASSGAVMPYKISWEQRGVYRHYYGDVTLVERRASLQAISSDHRFDELRYALSNYLDVQAYEVTPASTAELAALHIGPMFTNPQLRIVAVAQRPDILAAIADFQRHGFIKAPYHVFPTLPEARDWIATQLG